MADHDQSDAPWDFEAQRASAMTLLSRGLAEGALTAPGAPASHVLYLVPCRAETEPADPAALAAALEGAGAEVERRRENGVPYVIAIHDGIPLREGEIWAAERRMTEIALAHGFAPRGRCICDPGALPIPGSPQEMLALWDFDHQRRGSSARVQAGLEEGEARRGDPVALGLRFDGVFEWSDFAALEGALRRAGFAVLFRPSGGGIRHHVLAVMPDVTFGVEPIWTVERGATLTAIPHGFQPGGWEIVAPWPPAPGRRFMSWLRSFQVGPH